MKKEYDAKPNRGEGATAMPPDKLGKTDAREIVLAALEKRAGGTELSKRHGVHRSRVYQVIDEATKDPEGKLKEAEEEVEFRRRVLELLRRTG